MMDDTMADDLPASRSRSVSAAPESVASPRKRTLPAQKARKGLSHLSAKARASPFGIPDKKDRQAGDTWVNLEGDRFEMGEDGLQRRLCEVRELRRKYKMVSPPFRSFARACCLLSRPRPSPRTRATRTAT